NRDDGKNGRKRSDEARPREYAIECHLHVVRIWMVAVRWKGKGKCPTEYPRQNSNSRRKAQRQNQLHKSNENKMSDGGRGRASLGVKVWKSSQKWSVRRSVVRSIAWLGLCGFIGGRGATIGAQLHNKFFAIIAIAHILSCKLESAFL